MALDFVRCQLSHELVVVTDNALIMTDNALITTENNLDNDRGNDR